jgi:hypothetical protein
MEELRSRRAPPSAEYIDGAYILQLAPGQRLPVTPALIDLDEQLRATAEQGIDVMVSSPNLLGLPRRSWSGLDVPLGTCGAQSRRQRDAGRLPRARCLHPHLGGVLPYVLGRLERFPGPGRPL